MVNSALTQKVIRIIAEELEVIETNVTLDTNLYLDLFLPCSDAWGHEAELFFSGVFTELKRVFGTQDLFFLDEPDVSVREIVAYLEQIGCT